MAERWHATSIVAGTIIGSGIFLVPAEMMQAVGSAGLVYLAWIVGGLLSFFGALTYAELGSVRPYAGGEYVYVRDAYGPLPAFLYGWTWFLIAKPASIASVTAGLVRVLGTFSAFHFLPETLFSFHITSSRVLVITYGHLVAIAANVFITGLNYIGIRKAGGFQLAFTVLKVGMIVAIAVIALTAASGSWSNFGTSFAGATGGMSGFMAALVAALWAYDGWNDLNMVSEEIQRPEKNIPLALILGVGVVAVLYMGLNAGIQYALPAAAIAHAAVPAAAASEAALGHLGIVLVSIGMMISMLATLNGTVMSGGRVPFAVARDGYFFKALGEVHPKFHTPALALVIQGAGGDLADCRRGRFPGIVFAGHFRRVAVLHGGGEHDLRISQARTGCSEAIPYDRVSVCSGDIHRDGGCVAVLHVREQSAGFDWRSGGDSSWDTGVFVVRPSAGHG